MMERINEMYSKLENKGAFCHDLSIELAKDGCTTKGHSIFINWLGAGNTPKKYRERVMDELKKALEHQIKGLQKIIED